MNILNATELCTLNGYVVYILLQFFELWREGRWGEDKDCLPKFGLKSRDVIKLTFRKYIVILSYIS